MAFSLWSSLWSQDTPVKTRKGLIIIGLQNDFLSSEGKLPVNTPSGFLDRLSDLVQEFREHGDVVWVRSHFVENRTVNEDDNVGDGIIARLDAPDDCQPLSATGTPKRNTSASSLGGSDDEQSASPSKSASLSSDAIGPASPAHEIVETTAQQGLTGTDEELFLTRAEGREPCCIPGSSGAEFPTSVMVLVDGRRDLQLIKTYYSAFASTSLLVILRAKLITELYICGCTTNFSVFATAVDAARHGINVTLVEGCLGYHRRDRHDKAIKELHEMVDIRLMPSEQVIERLKTPLVESKDEASGTDGPQLLVDDDDEYEADSEEKYEADVATTKH